MKINSPKIVKFAGFGFLGMALLSFAGCSSLKSAIGGEKITPDEFRVVTKAPLVIPPEYNLVPPKQGEARPLELRPDMQAKTAVFGVQTGVAASVGEKLLVAKAGATNADPRIREILDEEAGGLSHKSDSFADKILFFKNTKKPDSLEPIDAQAEAEALKQETEAVNTVTGGQKVIIQQNKPSGIKLPGL